MMLWKLVSNWQQRRTVDFSKLWWRWRLYRKAGNNQDGWQVHERQINRIPGCLLSKWSHSISSQGVSCAQGWPWLVQITSNQQWQMLVLSLSRIVSRPNVTPGKILYCTTNCITIAWMSRKTFRLTHKFGTACAIEMAADREEWSELPMHPYTRLGTSVIRRSSVPPRAWVGPITNWSQPDTVAKSKAAIPWRLVELYNPTTPDDGHSNHRHMKDARTFSASTAAIDVSKQLKMLSSWSGLG